MAVRSYMVVIIITKKWRADGGEVCLLPRGSFMRRARNEHDVPAHNVRIRSQRCLRLGDACGESNTMIRNRWLARPSSRNQGTDSREEQKRNSSDLESDWSNEKFSRRFSRKLAGLGLAEDKGVCQWSTYA